MAPLRLELDDLSPAGDGVGAAEGASIEVPGAFPGELAEVAQVHRSRHAPRARARLLALVRPHPARRDPPCRHAGACSGCPLQALEVEAQRALKRELLARRFGRDPGPLIGGDPWGYRWSSKRVVTGSPGHVLLGSYQRGSHELAAMDECRVDHPAIAAAARELQALASAGGVVPYDEATGRGDLRYAWFKTDGREVLLTLITAAAPSPAAERLPALLQRPSGVAWSVQAGRGNALRGAETRLLRGADALEITLAGVVVRSGPLDFLQPNPRIAERAYLDLVADPSGAALAGDAAFDLYAGAGVTAALLRRGFARVLACEAYPASAARLGVPAETAEAFLARQPAAPALILANPPRGGMGPEVCAQLRRLAAPRLHVMSCSPEALARDLAALHPTYRLTQLRAYDTLPHTPHVELVAWLARA